MNKQSCENHIATLTKLRDEYRSQLDDGAMRDLDRLIVELKEVRDGGLDAAEVAKLVVRVVEAIAVVLTSVTNISDWLK
ncbi:hypothetical protein GNX71_04275 [Variovorax sp. RKNM96]|uniref:hypothetical protein n=1 Tax=Variovorax sp. RKNM96 TaxID=2681552 RepID=UPI001981458C|nr:hypothetical protein [Variovorax sp. RKNM96]QSI28836.1 hypothetical protein GNX71_04275 [Variovorax sp. RKNM96]